MLDPIADMLTRIRNAQRAGHKTVSFPASKIKLAILRVLEDRGFVGSIASGSEGPKETLTVTLKYSESAPLKLDPAIRELRRISKEGNRVYAKKGDVKKVKNGYGVAIVSTSKGVMAGEDAYRQGLGGEYICEVW
ncbi:MAG: 30S ribosomal protein S8 [Candidatus Moranbacteria bacterium]|jgi:small subunit ribosomal protein S8|nr:30S ribosomal protein S8 [Candidatus Moranbacteria bacterium]